MVQSSKNVYWRVVAAIFVLSLTIPAGGDPPASSLTIAFGTQEVTVGGVVGRHQVIAFGIGLGTFSHSPLLTRNVKALADDDGDGTITFPALTLTPSSVWVAVDMETGAYVITTPTGKIPKPLSFPAGSWRGSRADIDVERAYLEVLVVRPGVGAWTLRAADGGSNDADAVSNAVLRLRLDKMQKLAGEEKGPPFALPKDLIVLIDPHTLETFVGEAQ